MSKDNLFQSDNHPQKFSFNDQVTQVFDDMLNRSVPFYQNILNQIAQCCTMPTLPNGIIYDLGCSTGALIGALNIQKNDRQYVGIDNSEAMVSRHSLSRSTYNLIISFKPAIFNNWSP